MRKLLILSFISLDGVMQAPGGPKEDPSGGFAYGGWTFPYFDERLGNVMDQQMGQTFDLLLGRKTYEIFAAYWPRALGDAQPLADTFNRAKKYVASTTLKELAWQNSMLLKGDVAQAVKTIKEQAGPHIHVHGSGNLIQTLLKNDLVDELWLKIFPVTLGTGKRLFAEGTSPVGFTLTESAVTPSGVVVASYARAGEVKTGSFA